MNKNKFAGILMIISILISIVIIAVYGYYSFNGILQAILLVAGMVWIILLFFLLPFFQGFVRQRITGLKIVFYGFLGGFVSFILLSIPISIVSENGLPSWRDLFNSYELPLYPVILYVCLLFVWLGSIIGLHFVKKE